MTRIHRTPGLYWRLQFAGWSACAAFGFLWRVFLFQDLQRALVWTAIHEPLAFGISCLLRESYRRRSPQGPSVTLLVLRIVTSSGLAAMFDVAVVHTFLEWSGLGSPSWPLREQWVMRLTVYWLLFSGWSALYFWIKAEISGEHHRELAYKAETAALHAELNLLRSQLDPHFLFNTLNGIAAEIPAHPDRALAMTTELADYLRFSLDQRNHKTVPLKAEIDAMSAYLRIEQSRFGEELQIRIGRLGEESQRSIPAFTLQPLVENAVKHALRTSEPPWSVSLDVAARPESLVITVRNTGSLDHARPSDGPHVGLDLLRRRLALLYPGKHALSLEQEGGSVRAMLTLEGKPCA